MRESKALLVASVTLAPLHTPQCSRLELAESSPLALSLDCAAAPTPRPHAVARRYSEPFFALIIRESEGHRNYVRKAVNWALRQIGKRNRALNERAITVARTLAESENKTSRWIGSDALRELTSKVVRTRLKG